MYNRVSDMHTWGSFYTYREKFHQYVMIQQSLAPDHVITHAYEPL